MADEKRITRNKREGELTNLGRQATRADLSEKRIQTSTGAVP